jgi:hypothetical protein
MSKFTLKDTRDYLKELERKVLKPNDSNLRIRYVFFPTEIIKLGLENKFGITYMNTYRNKPLSGWIYFNIPYLCNHINKFDNYESIESKQLFLGMIFLHEYRHYLQNRDIEELRKYIFYTKLESILEKDAYEYAKIYLLNKIELPIDDIKKQVQEFYKDIPNCIKIRKWMYNRVETI